MGVFSDAFDKFGFSGFSLADIDWIAIIGWIFTVLIIIIGAGVIVYYIIILRKFNNRIVIWENVGGQSYEPTMRDRAKLVSLGRGGQKILYLLKNRIYRTAYGSKTGKNTYHFAIAQDGYWHNVIFKDLLGKNGAVLETVDPAMQYQYVALEQTIGQRYDKQGFWQKYGTFIATISLVFAVGIIAWLWFREWASYIGVAKEVADANIQVLEELGKILSGINNIQSGGSGLV